jgi:hypothetical protein
MPPNPFPNGFPQVNQGYAQPQVQNLPYYPMPAPPPITSPAYGAWSSEVDRRKQDEELRTLREQSATREREAVEARHKAELDRIRVEADQKAAAAQREMDRKFSELQSTIERLTSSAAKPAIDPAIEALKEQNRQLAEKADQDRRERDAERRDTALREMIKAQADASERRIEQMQAMHAASMQQMQTMITQITANANKPDALAPFIGMMQEQARSNADAIKEVARQNSDSMTKLSAFMMNPRDMISMARDTQVHTEATAERMSSMFGRAFDLQARAVDSALQMNQGGSQTAELVGMGIEKVTGIADRWIGGKSATEKFHLQAQRDVAEAQARAVEATAAVELARAGAVVTPPPVPQGQLSGPQAVPQQAAPKPVAIPKVPTFGKRGKREKAEPGAVEAKRLGRTDREWFTDALIENVENTRNGVAYFHESAAMTPPRLDKKKLDEDGHPMPEGISAPEVAMGVLQAVQMVQQVLATNPGLVPPPAMVDVLFQERYADFIDLLLPDASQKFRDDTVVALISMVKAATGETPQPKPATVAEVDHEDDDADENEEEDDDDADDGDEDPDNDGKVVEMKPPTKPTPRPNGRARA